MEAPADSKMADLVEPVEPAAPEPPAENAVEVDPMKEEEVDKTKAGPTRDRKESEGYGISEEQEKKLLAEDDEDLDVIECFVDDFDCDMEHDKKEQNSTRKTEDPVCVEEKKTETVEDNREATEAQTVEVFEVLGSAEEGSESEEKQQAEEVPAAAPAGEEEVDDDPDVIQIDEENIEMLLEETPAAEEESAKPQPGLSTHTSDETENARILSKPLVKQVVMNVSELANQDDDSKDRSAEQRSPRKDPLDDGVDRSTIPIEPQDDSDGEQPLVIADAVESSAAGFLGCQQEDPAVHQLKLDLYQSIGEMDYEPEEDEEKLERRFRIKDEPLSPVEDRMERIMLVIEEIPTIDLLTSDEDDSSFVQQQEPEKPKKAKRKPKKKAKQSNKDEDCMEPVPVIPSPSEKSIVSNDSGASFCLDEDLYKTGFRMELRKRKSVTHVEEDAAPTLAGKRRKSIRNSKDSCAVGRSRSKGSIISTESSNLEAEECTAFQPLSTEDELKINSLFADCEKQIIQPEHSLDAMESILDDGKPLIEQKVPRKQAPRQTMIIDALPLPAPSVKAANKSRKISAMPKPDLVPADARQQILQSLEEDLAMSSSGEEMPREEKSAPVQNRPLDMPMVVVHRKKVSWKKQGRKRQQQQKQLIDDYFGATSSGDKEDACKAVCCQSESPIGRGAGTAKKSSAKRRKKRRISSSSEDETAESVSLGGTTTPSRSTTTMGDEEPQAAAAAEESSHEPDPVESDLDCTAQDVQSALSQTKEMRIVLSPLEQTLKRINSKEVPPKNVRPLSKATQTEVEGLTWSVEFNRINFNSEFFKKLNQLINQGMELQNSNQSTNGRRNLANNNFEGVIMAGRGVVAPPSPPAPPTRASPPPRSSAVRSNVQQLLFQRRIDEIPIAPTVRIDQRDRDRMERSVMFNFRIPKVVKQPSSSPQDVTSSTHREHDSHFKEEADQRATANSSEEEHGARPSSYSNDRPVLLDPRRNVVASVAGRSSPLRFEDVNVDQRFRPENEQPSDNPRPFIMRRTIHNDHVQPPQQPAAPQPVQNGFATYGGLEPKYENNVQLPQQLPQRGGFVAPQPEVDVKPNLPALATQMAMFANPSMVNTARYLEALNVFWQMTQQQPSFPPINPILMYPGQHAMPAANFAHASAPPQMAQQPHAAPGPSSSNAEQRYVREPVAPDVGYPAPAAAARSNELCDQINEIFGCYDLLTGKCVRNPCPYPHTFPSDSNLFYVLRNKPTEVIMSTYRFVAERENLFRCYFPVYAEIMGRANLRHQLVDTIADCEEKRAFCFYRNIVDGLALSGTLSRERALKILLEKHTKKNFDQVNKLVTLILDGHGDIPLFLQWLEEFSRVQGYSFEIASINRLVEFCVQASGSNALDASVVNVAKLTYKLLLDVGAGRESMISSGRLLEFVKLLLQSNVGLNVDEIRRKYRTNEMFDRR